MFPAYHYERTFRANWSNEAKAFFAAFELPHQVTSGFQYEVNEIEVIFGGPRAPDCAPDPTWDFCRDLRSPAYRIYQVSPERSTWTIRRVLASFFLGINPLPGLMNVTGPFDEQSAFERQTIRMILLRKLPNRWPDSDR